MHQTVTKTFLGQSFLSTTLLYAGLYTLVYKFEVCKWIAHLVFLLEEQVLTWKYMHMWHLIEKVIFVRDFYGWLNKENIYL